MNILSLLEVNDNTLEYIRQVIGVLRSNAASLDSSAGPAIRHFGVSM